MASLSQGKGGQRPGFPLWLLFAMLGFALFVVHTSFYKAEDPATAAPVQTGKVEQNEHEETRRLQPELVGQSKPPASPPTPQTPLTPGPTPGPTPRPTQPHNSWVMVVVVVVAIMVVVLLSWRPTACNEGPPNRDPSAIISDQEEEMAQRWQVTWVRCYAKICSGSNSWGAQVVVLVRRMRMLVVHNEVYILCEQTAPKRRICHQSANIHWGITELRKYFESKPDNVTDLHDDNIKRRAEVLHQYFILCVLPALRASNTFDTKGIIEQRERTNDKQRLVKQHRLLALALLSYLVQETQGEKINEGLVAARDFFCEQDDCNAFDVYKRINDVIIEHDRCNWSRHFKVCY